VNGVESLLSFISDVNKNWTHKDKD